MMKTLVLRKYLCALAITFAAGALTSGCGTEQDDANLDGSAQRLRGTNNTTGGWDTSAPPRDQDGAPTVDPHDACGDVLVGVAETGDPALMEQALHAYELCITGQDGPTDHGCSVSQDASGMESRECPIPADQCVEYVDEYGVPHQQCAGGGAGAPGQEHCQLLTDDAGNTFKVCVPSAPGCRYAYDPNGAVVLVCAPEPPDLCVDPATGAPIPGCDPCIGPDGMVLPHCEPNPDPCIGPDGVPLPHCEPDPDPCIGPDGQPLPHCGPDVCMDPATGAPIPGCDPCIGPDGQLLPHCEPAPDPTLVCDPILDQLAMLDDPAEEARVFAEYELCLSMFNPTPGCTLLVDENGVVTEQCAPTCAPIFDENGDTIGEDCGTPPDHPPVVCSPVYDAEGNHIGDDCNPPCPDAHDPATGAPLPHCVDPATGAPTEGGAEEPSGSSDSIGV